MDAPPMTERLLFAAYRGAATEDVALERCTGDSPACPHTECPDGWHWGDDLPCACTPDCALAEEGGAS